MIRDSPCIIVPPLRVKTDQSIIGIIGRNAKTLDRFFLSMRHNVMGPAGNIIGFRATSKISEKISSPHS